MSYIQDSFEKNFTKNKPNSSLVWTRDMDWPGSGDSRAAALVAC